MARDNARVSWPTNCVVRLDLGFVFQLLEAPRGLTVLHLQQIDFPVLETNATSGFLIELTRTYLESQARDLAIPRPLPDLGGICDYDYSFDGESCAEKAVRG